MANFIHALVFLSFASYNFWLATARGAHYNVVNYGAKPDGRTDSSNAFLAAWKEACAFAGSIEIYVPKGRFAISKAVAFTGPCKNNATLFRIDGTLLAPSDYEVIGNSGTWIIFQQVTGVRIVGGVLDGQGAGLWSCKTSGKNCPTGATSLEFTNSNNIGIRRLVSLNSQMFHIVINECQNVNVKGVKIIAPGNSPNTDGIHVGGSTHVNIFKTKIGTGDDCVSIGPATSNLWVENVICGPGHGISIGRLGRDLEENGVQNVTVRSSTIVGTQNGVRIKTWGRQSNSFARNIHFQNIVMNNVQNPIIIDQNYCPGYQGCPGHNSGVRISDVTYQDIRGSSATDIAMKFDCSKKYPCQGIKLQDVKLSCKNQQSRALCAHAAGIASGFVEPKSCL
ncbi:hypothetical protein JCGZ_13538 [Jatropha curcas]|uniref:Polygalacturonase n=1 Tax=Jatropha curcas TaxID=180498 RepID=A0A067KA84_JATCU|nr:hypothetical protein JCGZ_13538 [Jatropha curcas]